MPAFVSVEPAAICQLHCPECPVGMGNKSEKATQKTPFMSREVWERVLGDIKETAHTVQFYFQGEPLLNKDLPAMIAEAHEAGLYTILSTNAQALTPEMAEALVKAGLSRIIISMDGLTQDTYGAYRIGGSVEKVKIALQWLQKAKSVCASSARSSLVIELQCLRLQSNEHEWCDFKKQYKTLGADRLVFKTAQLYNYSAGHPLMPSDPRYSRYSQGEDGLYHRKPLHRGCLRVWSGVVITTTGEVLPCCYDKNHSYAYGNIMNTPLAELFTNENARAFRNAALHEKPQICQECWR
ncbi:MAG: SPASM domain-containing protein [Paludibacteraceae bacterium]|nr:SPASM domain-containing protein [Paludibacteraceae bacterium]